MGGLLTPEKLRYEDLDQARFILDRTHAFADPNEADAAGIRLTLPAPEIL